VEKRVQVAVSGIQRRKFSKAEYYRMAEMGFFNGQRVELIDGEGAPLGFGASIRP
jgi:Fe2+ transport system protein FeoA